MLPRTLRKLSCVKCGAASHAFGVSEKDIRTIYGSEYKLASTAPKSDSARAHIYARWIQHECAAPQTILEIGCGSGALLQELSVLWPEARCFGVDPALAGADRSNSKIRLERGFVEDIPAEIRNFDLIVAVNVIEHLPRPDKFLASLRSRLAESGKIVIVCPAVNPPNVELLFYDHLYSLTANALGSAARTASLVGRKGATAPAAIGDFQMIVFDTADQQSTLFLQQNSFSELWSERQFYLERWRSMDQALLDRSRTASRVVAFGGGQTAALLRAYAPRTWGRIELVVLDDTNEAWDLAMPIAPYQNAMQNLQAAQVLIATAPRSQKIVAERLRRDGLQPITWDDVIAN
jgi:SAM-dependent methyltransferase